MKQLLMVLAFGCMVASPLRARSCFCITPELSESFKQSRTVFLGEVLDIVKPKTSNDDAPLVDRAFTVKFKILQTWKGIPFSAAELNILWLTDCYECLHLPQPKNRYLVFADPVSGSANWSIVGSCNRTALVDNDPKLRLMNSGISGRVTDRNGAVIVRARITLVARSSNRSVIRSTNDEGQYVADLDPGTYDVIAEANGFKKATRKSIPVEREGRSYVDFVLAESEGAIIRRDIMSPLRAKD